MSGTYAVNLVNVQYVSCEMYLYNSITNFQSNVFSVLVGSAHTVLGSYWSMKLGKKKMLGN